MLQRKECVICDEKLVEISKKPGYPMCLYHTAEPQTNDIFTEQILGSCTKCRCIQMMNLCDPAILYSNAHNDTFNTPTWKEHHELFANFIKSNNPSNTLMEVGGNPYILPQKLPNINFKILNLCKSDLQLPNVEFICGNCEEYTYEPGTNIVMSHVFEHLYNPKKFVKSVSESKVSKLFISIPNMNAISDEKPPFLLHFEHTFFINSIVLDHLFTNANYKCTATQAFKNHSNFYCYEYDPSTVPTQLPTLDISTTYINFLNTLESNMNKIQNIDIDFIVPGGHYGQTLYSYYKGDIIGFIDNDKSKQGLRLYGTDKIAFSMDKLKEYVKTHLSILVYAGLYTTELVNQIRSLDIHNKWNIVQIY